MIALMPYSIAIGPLGTLLTLEIASLRGLIGDDEVYLRIRNYFREQCF